MPRLLTVMVFVAAGIASAPAAPIPTHLMPKDPPAYWPTVVGTRLVYLRGENEETWEVTKVEETKGGKLVTTESVQPDGTRTPHWTVLVAADGLSLVAETGDPYDPPWRLLQAAGPAWQTATTRGRLRITGSSRAGRPERVRAAGGEFDAVPVAASWGLDNGPSQTITSYYARGVGLVRMDAGGQSLVLKSFTPGK